MWKLFWLISPNLGFSVSCGAMPQTFVFSFKKSTRPQKSPPSLQCCFNFAPLVCLQGHPYAMATTGSAKRLAARPERREEWVQTPSFHPSLFQSLEFSPSHTFHLFSSLPPVSLCFHSPSNKSTKYFNLSLTSFFPFPFSIPLHPFLFHLHLSVIMSFLAEVQLVVFGLTAYLITHHTVWEKHSQANKLREVTARDHEMMSSLVSCKDILGHKTNSSLFVATCDKRGLVKCLDDAHADFTEVSLKTLTPTYICAYLWWDTIFSW